MVLLLQYAAACYDSGCRRGCVCVRVCVIDSPAIQQAADLFIVSCGSIKSVSVVHALSRSVCCSLAKWLNRSACRHSLTRVTILVSVSALLPVRTSALPAQQQADTMRVFNLCCMCDTAMATHAIPAAAVVRCRQRSSKCLGVADA
jgi:hypothetical protein